MSDMTMRRVAATLDTVIADFGRRVIDDPRRLRALLSDALGADAAECREALEAVVVGTQSGVARSLLGADGSFERLDLLETLASSLAEPALAEPVLDAWIGALHVEDRLRTDTGPTQLRRAPAAPIELAPTAPRMAKQSAHGASPPAVGRVPVERLVGLVRAKWHPGRAASRSLALVIVVALLASGSAVGFAALQTGSPPLPSPTPAPPTATATSAPAAVLVPTPTATVTPTPTSTLTVLVPPATPTPEPATPTPEPATPTPEPATSTPKPATSTPKPATSTPKPATSTPKPATSTPKPTATPRPNRPPVASLATYSASTSAGWIRACVLQRASDPDGDPLTLVSVTRPKPVGKSSIAGAVSGQKKCKQSVRFEWPANWTGVASMNWTVSDGRGGTATAELRVTVNPVNNPPVASLATYSASTSTGWIRACVLQRASDPDGDPLTLVSVTKPTPVGQSSISGAISGLPNCNQTVRFEWPANWTGVASMYWTVSDGRGGTATAELRVTVNP